MKQTLSLYDFRDAFKRMRPDNFSYDALEIIFNYLEELETDTGQQIELDVIGICCDFSEIPEEDLISDEEDGYANSTDAVGEIIGRTDHSVVVINE